MPAWKNRALEEALGTMDITSRGHVLGTPFPDVRVKRDDAK